MHVFIKDTDKGVTVNSISSFCFMRRRITPSCRRQDNSALGMHSPSNLKPTKIPKQASSSGDSVTSCRSLCCGHGSASAFHPFTPNLSVRDLSHFLIGPNCARLLCYFGPLSICCRLTSPTCGGCSQLRLGPKQASDLKHGAGRAG